MQILKKLWPLTTNTIHFQLIFEGKLNNNTEISLFLGETNCHTSCIIMSVKKSKHDLSLYCWHFFGKIHLNRCPRCVWLLWAILSPQKQFPQLFPHQLTLNLNHRDLILIHHSKTTLHSLDEIEYSMAITSHLRQQVIIFNKAKFYTVLIVSRVTISRSSIC